MASSLDLSTVLRETVEAACELTGARYGALAVFDSSGRVTQFQTNGVTLKQRKAIGSPPKGLGILGYINEFQQSLRLSDLTEHPKSVGFPSNHPTMKTFLGAPIRRGKEVLGNLYLTEKAGGQQFTSEDEELLVLFAAQVAMAIHNARLHQQVENERHRLDAILNDSPNGMIYVDAGTGQVQANSRAEEMLDCSFTPTNGLKPLDGRFSTPDGTAVVLKANPLSRALQGEVIPGEEYLISRPNGQDMPILSSASPIRDKAGALLGAVIRFRDITSVKDAQRQIEQEQKRLEVLVNTSPVGVFVVDAGGEVTLVNQEAERILGLSHQPDDRLERYEQAATHRRPDGTIYDIHDLPLQRALYTGENVRAEEVRFEFPDGHSISTLLNATPLYSPDGQISGAIAIIQDMTPLEEVDRLRSEFLGMVSHELKTPLTAIKGSAATVLGSRRPFSQEETLELFKIIDEQSDRLRELIDNILDMTRIEAGALSVTPEPLQLEEVLEDAKATFTRGGAPQDVQLSYPDDLPLVNADRRRAGQVISNLLSNASKFSPPTAPITVSVEQTDTYVTVHVQDQGQGIPTDKLPHLFKKFSQVHEDQGQKLAGSGLGLAISKGIVEAHGGRIWAESSGESRGTTFSFTLPVASQIPASRTADTARRDQHMGRIRRAGERARILAVDDDPQVLRYLQRSFEEAGYHAITTGDPSQVIRLVETEEPDLVILDLVLPGTTGLELLQRIREFSGVPIIFLTASNEADNATLALRMGADDYMTKPFSPTELLARIEATLRRRVLPDQIEVRPPFTLGDLTINFGERRVVVKGQPVSLSATEYKLLYELVTHAGLVLTHDQILQRVWGPEYTGATELIRSFIRNLRRKLGDDAHNPQYIYTEPQVGYRVPRP